MKACLTYSAHLGSIIRFFCWDCGFLYWSAEPQVWHLKNPEKIVAALNQNAAGRRALRKRIVARYFKGKMKPYDPEELLREGLGWKPPVV